MPIVGSTNFQWFQPNESTLSEAFGGDSSQAQAVVQIKGDAATRRQCAADLLEYPVFVVNGKFRYISRHLPLAYPAPFVSGESDDGVQLYAARFAGGKGVGPRGQDAGAPAAGKTPAQVPLPVYQVYQYDLEFTDRTYDLLPDAAIAAPGPIATPGGVAATGVAGGGALFAAYNVAVSAVSAFGETDAVQVGPVAIPNNSIQGSLNVSWNAVAGAVAYKVYVQSVQGNAWQVVFNGTTPNNSIIVLNLAGGQPAPNGPPAVNTSGSPLYDAVNNVGYPDEGAALAAGDGQLGGRYVTRNSRPAGRGVTIPRSFMYYRPSGVSIPEGMMKVVPTCTLVYSWHQVPRAAVPGPAIRASLGCLNNAPFDGWPTGTVLFESVDPRRYRSPLGARLIDLQYTFIGAMNIDLNGVAQGHNSALEFTGGPMAPAGAFRAGKPGRVDYSPVSSDPGNAGNPPYRSADFSALFRPTPGV